MQQEQKKTTKVTTPNWEKQEVDPPLEEKEKKIKTWNEKKRRNEMGGTFPPR